MHSYKRRLHTYRRRKSPLSVIINLIIFLCLICCTIAYAEKQPFHPKESEGPIIGIDLGTTYSCLAVFENGSTKVIPNEQGNRITPSVVAFIDVNERLVGDAAKNQATTNPENTVYDVKRLIGRDFNDPSIQADKKLVPFNIVSDSLGKPRISIKHNTGERVYSPEEISGLILAKMKSIAESYLGREISRAVVTVPAYFNQAQREATKDAGRIAGLTVERIINEPTAAAIAYGLDQDGGVEDKNVLVYDLGGGTFDVTLLNLDEGVFDVLSSEGDTHLGGEDFDQRVMKHFVNVMKKKSGIDISNEKKSLQKLRKEVERVKRALSSQKQARLEIEDIVPGYDLQETLTRARFEELNNDLFKRTLKPVKSVLERAGLEKSDVDHIVLVGGSTRIPRVQELLSDFFDGRQLSKKIDPDEAVAFGAGVQGSILGGHSGEYADVILLDKTSLSLGIETVGGVFVPVVKRDTSIPTKKSKTFSTNQDSQSTVVIDVYEGERAMTKDNHPLGKFELSGIPPAARGVPQIEVTFQVDSNGILEVSAVDKGTGKSETITITSEKGRLSEEEIQRMIHEAEVYADEDRKVKERTDAKNGLESYLYHLKNSLEDDNLADLLVQEEKQELLELIDEKLEWLEEQVEHSKSDLDDHRREVEQVANPLMRQINDHITPGSRDEEYYDSGL